jgi:Bacterial Ig-like domain (group 2)/Beta xylosidase C-terminal Concanavalin A-like domain
MKKLICAVLLAGSLEAHAANYPISAGASVSTIVSTIGAAAAATGPNTVTFAAGNYTIDSQITIPCPVSPMTIQGPPVPYVPPTSVLAGSYSYTSPYAAKLLGATASSFGWQLNSCAVPVTIQYFEWNGRQPSGGGGGWLIVLGGQNGTTVRYNYIHGNWASTSVAHNYDSLIRLDGPSQAPTPVDANVSIVWNVFGDGSSDCNPIMNLYTYQGSTFNSSGGYCNGVGVAVSTTNVLIQNNDFEHLEQGIKFFEGSGAPNDPNHTYLLVDGIVDRNDFGQIHRIPLEAQQTVATGPAASSQRSSFYLTNNSQHDFISPAFGTFGFSIPMCCGGYTGYNPDNQINCGNNTMVDNNPTPSSLTGSGAHSGEAFEWWGTGYCSNNLIQGYYGSYGAGASGGPTPNSGGAGVAYGYTNTTEMTWVANNNTCQFTYSSNSGCVSDAGYGSTPPTQSGNVTSTGATPRTTFAPTISPTGGSQSYPLRVTFTDPGYTSGSGPLGNTGIWYTTDGSSPVPGAGTARYIASGGTIVLNSATTLKAVGMWGALNQPTSYPSGYGHVPSPVISAVFKGGSGSRLVSAHLVPNGGVKSIPVGGTLQFIAHGVYSDGTSAVLPDSEGNAVTAWNTSNHNIAKISSLGHVTAMGVGTATIEGFIGNIEASTSEVTVTPIVASNVLVSAYLVSNGGVKSISLGRTLQFIAHGVYSDGSVQVLPDSMGNKVTAWNTSNHNIAKISSLGHVTAMGVGTATIEGFIGNIEASTSVVTVTPIIASSVQAAVVEPPSAALMESPSGSVPAAPSSPIGDKFLGPLWKVLTPAGGSASISNGHLFLRVPGGSNHDTLLPLNQAVRAVQAIGDTDFDVSIKIDSEIQASDADTSQGLMVLADDDAFITFALTTDGTNIGLVARTVNAGVSTTVLEDTTFTQYQNPMYLRLTRSGAAYMASYSTDGTHWTQATSFTDAEAFTLIGPFDSNYNSSPEKAVPVVMSVGWFNVE